ncbi:MAG TPA: protein kinase [Pyrinomonadaceae bacterium]|nr:protein kinase [Pyrinomonadaceae bacterium]
MILTIGEKIEHYEIIELLGAGGMGEVYAAHDTKLERKVALKILKNTDSKENLDRFRQEAKAILTLNHPNIVTVYDFGKFENYHFIVTELIEGETLRQKISQNSLSLSEILDIAAQSANALAAAHRANIVHRDIKPENLMILPDGYVKVLDFGLAKLLTPDGESNFNPELSTASIIQTKAGMIIGTVNYMSPEQLRGQNDIDGRTDIWSLGIVLFEMLAGQKPFRGGTVSDVIAAVIERPLPALKEFAPNITEEIEKTVETALKKDRVERWKNAADFSAELKKCRSFIDSAAFLQNSQGIFTSETGRNFATLENKNETANAENLQTSAEKTKSNWKIFSAFGALLLLIAGGFFIFQYFAKSSDSAKQKNVKPLSANGNIINAVISPDGKFVVYVQEENGKNGVWIRQTDESGGRILLAPDFKSYSGLNFAPDSKSVYYSVFGKDGVGNLFKLPIMSETSQLIAKNIDSGVSFSPDGNKIAFLSRNSEAGIDRVIVADADGQNQQTLIEKKQPEFLLIAKRSGLTWSADGKNIVCAAGKREADGELMKLVEINVETQTEKDLTSLNWSRIGKIIRTNKQNELILTADAGKGLFQIFRVSTNENKSDKIGDDLSDYTNVSLSADGNFLLAVKDDKTSNIYRAPNGDFAQSLLIEKSVSDGVNGLSFASDGKVFYVSSENGSRDIWRMKADGSERQPVTFDKSAEDYPFASADGKFVVFVSNQGGSSHIWRMDADGANRKQLTSQSGEVFPQVLPDGKTVIYSRNDQGFALWKISAEGGEPQKLTDFEAHWAAVSPDGKSIASLIRDEKKEIKLGIVSAENGKLLQSFKADKIDRSPEFPPVLRWMPDGKSVAFISTAAGVSNLFAQSLNGGEPQKLTDFSADRIFNFDWSKDGKQIVYARGTIRHDIVLFENF